MILTKVGLDILRESAGRLIPGTEEGFLGGTGCKINKLEIYYLLIIAYKSEFYGARGHSPDSPANRAEQRIA